MKYLSKIVAYLYFSIVKSVYILQYITYCFTGRMDRYRFTLCTFIKLEHLINVQEMMHARVPHMGA